MNAVVRAILLLFAALFTAEAIWGGYWATALLVDGYSISGKVVSVRKAAPIAGRPREVIVKQVVRDSNNVTHDWEDTMIANFAPTVGHTWSCYMLTGPIVVSSAEISWSLVDAWSFPVLSLIGAGALMEAWRSLKRRYKHYRYVAIIMAVIAILAVVGNVETVDRALSIRGYVIDQRLNNEAKRTQGTASPDRHIQPAPGSAP